MDRNAAWRWQSPAAAAAQFFNSALPKPCHISHFVVFWYFLDIITGDAQKAIKESSQGAVKV